MAHEVSDRYYKLGSSVDITCQVALSFLNTIPSSTTNSSDRLQATFAAESTTKTVPTTTVFPFIDINLIKKTIEQQIPYSGNHNIKWRKDGKDLPKDIKINLRFVRRNQISHLFSTAILHSTSIIYSELFLPSFLLRKQHNTHLAKQ